MMLFALLTPFILCYHAAALVSPGLSSNASNIPVSNGPYSFISTHSGVPAVHLQTLYASGGHIQLGGNRADSPVSTVDALFYLNANGQGTVGLNKNADGFLLVYVDLSAESLLSYAPYNPIWIPTAAKTTTFALGVTENFVFLTLDGKQQFIACPSILPSSIGVYDIYVGSTTRTDCYGIDIISLRA